MENLQKRIIQIKCCCIAVLLLGGMNTWAQSGSEGNTYIENDAEVVQFGAHNFLTGSGTYPGVIGTERDATPGYWSVASTGSWTGASTAAHVDGYVKSHRTDAFVFPVGDNGAYRPVALSVATEAAAAYYGVDPGTAITSRIDGTNFGSLPGGNTFHPDSVDSDVQNVSTSEYWDINGIVSSTITLTWDAASDVTTMTGSDLDILTIVGWDGTQWERIPSTVDAMALVQGTSAATYTGSASSLTAGSITTDAALVPDDYEVYTLAAEVSEVCLTAKAYLQGALYLSSNDTMTDDLRSNGVLPMSEPYAALSNFTHAGSGGSETTTAAVLAVTGANAIVDWVFIELRDTGNSATVLETQSALIQRDGDVVSASDGTSGVCFASPVSDSVFVAIRHRNHLGVMADSPVKLTPAGTSVDFSTTTLFGTNAAGNGLKSNGSNNTVVGLWPGNTNANTAVIYDNSSSDLDQIASDVLAAPGNFFNNRGFIYTAQYRVSDVNMDSQVIFDNSASDRDPIIRTVVNFPANFFGSPGYTNVVERLP